MMAWMPRVHTGIRYGDVDDIIRDTWVNSMQAFNYLIENADWRPGQKQLFKGLNLVDGFYG